jgi:hypothetical protein
MEPDTGAVAGAAPVTPPAQLPRDLIDFLVQFSLALQKYAIYPAGHPMLGEASAELHGTLTILLHARPVLSIGVAHRQLVIEGVASDSVHPLLRQLAGKLHRHHLGAVKFIRGVTRDELTDALATVGVEALRETLPLGLQPGLEARWTNVKLFPQMYDRMELLDEEDELDASGRSGGQGPGDSRAAHLWIGLAHAAIAAERSDSAAEDDTSLEPEQVARAINQHEREPAYDQVIVGYLLQIAHEVRRDDTVAPTDTGLQRRISKLVGTLQPETLKRLIEMGGNSLQRRTFVLDATDGMTVDAILDLVKAAADAEKQAISHSLVRMLTKLAAHATGEVTPRSSAADGEFRDNIRQLVGSWSLDDPNPQEYSVALEQLSRTSTDSAAADADTRFLCEPSRVIAMALELGLVSAAVTRAVLAAVRAESFGELLDLLDAAPAMHDRTIAQVWALVTAAAPLSDLLARPNLSPGLIRRVVARSEATAGPVLLDALEASQEGVQRDLLSGHLSSLGEVAVPAIGSRLGRATPSMVRELLAILTQLAPQVLPVEVQGLLMHDDPAIRREAARLLLGYDDTRESTVARAVRDTDERVVYVGLLAAQERCAAAVAATIRYRMDQGELSETTTRVAAIRAVAASADDEALTWLLRRAQVTSLFLRRKRLAPTSRELLVTLSVVASGWERDPRAATVLAWARASRSPSVRAAAQGQADQGTDESEPGK